jgi:urea transporter
MDHEQRVVRFRAVARDASWSMGMALFGFSAVFVALGLHPTFHRFRFWLWEVASVEALMGAVCVWSRIWENAIGVVAHNSELHAWRLSDFFQLSARSLVRISLGVSLTLLVIEALERERVGVPDWGEILIVVLGFGGSLVFAALRGAQEWPAKPSIKALRKSIGVEDVADSASSPRLEQS